MAQRTREHHEAGERAEAERLANEAAELEIAAGEGFGGQHPTDTSGAEPVRLITPRGAHCWITPRVLVTGTLLSEC